MVGRLRMLMSTADCLERYGSKYRIAKAVQSGELRRISNGIYSEGARPREIEILLFKYPTSVVTMLSAYYYYNLTDVVPDKCHLAVERNGTKITDSSVVEYFVPAGTGAIGVENAVLRGIPLRIFDRERLLVETVRLRTKLPIDLYREVIGNYRKMSDELYPAKIDDYLESFPKGEFIFDTIRNEVL